MEWLEWKYKVNVEHSEDPAINMLLKIATDSGIEPPPMPEALSLYYTLKAHTMQYTAAVGYENQPWLHISEMNICMNAIAQTEEKSRIHQKKPAQV